MTHREDVDLELSREDVAFIERLRANHELAPMPPARKAAFLRGVNERRKTRPRWRAAVPALVVPAAALAAAWLYLSGAGAPPVIDSPSAPAAGAEADLRWALEVLYPPELDNAEETEDLEMLPEDYLAIGSELLGV